MTDPDRPVDPWLARCGTGGHGLPRWPGQAHLAGLSLRRNSRCFEIVRSTSSRIVEQTSVQSFSTRGIVEAIIHLEPLLAPADQAGIGQELEMLGDVRLAPPGLPSPPAPRSSPLHQGPEDRQAGGIGQHLELLGHQLQQVVGHGCDIGLTLCLVGYIVDKGHKELYPLPREVQVQERKKTDVRDPDPDRVRGRLDHPEPLAPAQAGGTHLNERGLRGVTARGGGSAGSPTVLNAPLAGWTRTGRSGRERSKIRGS